MVLVGCGSNENNRGPVVVNPITPSVPDVIPPGTTMNNFVGALSIHDRKTFEMFLQNTVRCDPYSSGPNWGIEFGNLACSTYSEDGFMVISIPATSGTTLPATANITIGAGADEPGRPNKKWWFTTHVHQVGGSMQLAMANENRGFTGTAVGSTLFPGNFRFVTIGLPGNSYSLQVTLHYNGLPFATGQLTLR
jgi:hypothetical protein